MLGIRCVSIMTAHKVIWIHYASSVEDILGICFRHYLYRVLFISNGVYLITVTFKGANVLSRPSILIK